jgi:membrane protein
LKPLPAFLRDAAGFVAFVFRRWGEDRCPQVAGSLTFTTLLALVPLFTVAMAVLAAMPFFESALVQVKVFLLLNLVPEIAGRIITVHMGQIGEAAARLTWLSLAVVGAMALATLFTVDHALNSIWRVDQRRPLWLSVAGYAALLVLGPVLIVMSVGATSWIVQASLDRVTVPSQVESTVLRIVPVAVSTLAFFLLYRIFPNRHVPARHALAGGLLAAVVFEAMKSLFAGYVRSVPTYRLVYGAYAAIPVFLVWVYLSWLVVLLGAEFTAALAWWRGRHWQEEAAGERQARGAFEIGRALAEAGGGPVTQEALRGRTGLPDEALERTLALLENAGAARRTPAGWRAGAGDGTDPPA